jgi:kynurenine formamidase
MKKYKAMYNEIKEVEIKKETPKMVVLTTTGWDGEPNRELKDCKWYSYQETFEDAKKWLLSRALKSVESKKSALAYAEEELEKVSSL